MKTRKIMHFLRKIRWFQLIAGLAAVAWFTVYTLLWVLTKSLNNVMIPISVATAVLLIVFVGFYVLVARKSKKRLVRWTGKSLMIMSPFMVLCALGLLALASLGNQTAHQFSATEGLKGQQVYVDGFVFSDEELLAATNEERTKNSKPPLALNAKLNDSALRKCQDMVKQNYWSHDDPSGGTPWRFIGEAGYNYTNAGENLAYGFNSESGVTTGWMNSEGHRKNILGDYTEVGFGVCVGENYVGSGKQLIVVQHLATPQAKPPTALPTTQSTPQYKPYVAPVCTRTAIPYQTKYIDASYMYVGETSEYGGQDGYTETCTADSTGYKPTGYTSSPYDKTIYRGTKPQPATSVPSSPSCSPDGYGGWLC